MSQRDVRGINAALQAIGGTFAASPIALVASGLISVGVTKLDISLPAEFATFKFEFYNWFPSVRDGWAAAVSYDGGATLLNDAVNFDTYLARGAETSTPAGAVTPERFTDAVIDPVDFQDISANSATGTHLSFDLFPGDATSYFTLLSNGGSQDHAATLQTWFSGFTTLNPLATAGVPPKGRVNFLRVAPYGTGNLNPPGGHTMTCGYRVWGFR